MGSFSQGHRRLVRRAAQTNSVAILATGIIVALAASATLAGPAAAQGGGQTSVAALGRLEPRGGVFEIAGPATGGVIAKLLVDEGDWVEEGQVIAELDSVSSLSANVARLEAERATAVRERDRYATLSQGGAAAATKLDAAKLRVAVADAQLEGARAELALARVKAPVKGRVLEVHSRRGERIGPKGIAEVGRVDEMFAIAEVYETDIRFVKIGQKVEIESPALATPLTGTVSAKGHKVGKLDVLGTDPAAATDARVVEVDVRLDDSEKAADLTNLQVEVEIATSGSGRP